MYLRKTRWDNEREGSNHNYMNNSVDPSNAPGDCHARSGYNDPLLEHGLDTFLSFCVNRVKDRVCGCCFRPMCVLVDANKMQ